MGVKTISKLFLTESYKVELFFSVVLSSLIGVYTRVLVGISSRVLPKFFLIFAVALFVWGGAFYPALRSHTRGTVNTTEVVFGGEFSIHSGVVRSLSKPAVNVGELAVT